MSCEDKIKFVDWDTRFSEEDKNTIRETMIDMAEKHDRYRFIFINGVEYEIVVILTTCDECPPNDMGEAHFMLLEVIEDSSQVCMFRDYKCGVSWVDTRWTLQRELFGIDF